MTKACPNCGVENPSVAKFCASCANPLRDPVKFYDGFISYRRDGGSETARLLRLMIETGHNKNLFLDVEELRTGRFDEKILTIIENSDNFILILSPGCLSRCMNEDDWLRREIVAALRHKKNIIPVMIGTFDFPPDKELPEEIRSLKNLNAVQYNHQYCDAAVGKIVRNMVHHDLPETASQPTPADSAPVGRQPWNRRAVLFAACAIPALVLLFVLLRFLPNTVTIVVEPEGISPQVTLGGRVPGKVDGSRYMFSRVKSGEHLIQVSADGYAPKTVGVQTSRGSSEHTIRLDEQSGILTIRSLPDAVIRLVRKQNGQMSTFSADSNGICRPPEKLRAGLYSLSVKKTGYFDYQRDELIVEASRPVDVEAKPGPRPGSINITSNPAGAEFFVDGVSRGKTPLQLADFPANVPILGEIRLEGYETQKKSFTLQPMENVEWAAGPLVLLRGQIAIAGVRSELPSEGFLVEVDGNRQEFELRDDELRVAVLPGRHSIRISHPDYEALAGEIDGVGGKVTPWPARLAALVGFIKIEATEDFTVLVDNIEAKMDRNLVVKAKPGEGVRIVARKEGRVSAARTFSVKAGETTSWRVALPARLEGKALPKSFAGLDIEEKSGGGVVCKQVVKGGPAAVAGIVEGDLLTQIDDLQLSDSADLLGVLNAHLPGQTVSISVKRDTAEPVAKSVTLVAHPGEMFPAHNALDGYYAVDIKGFQISWSTKLVLDFELADGKWCPVISFYVSTTTKNPLMNWAGQSEKTLYTNFASSAGGGWKTSLIAYDPVCLSRAGGWVEFGDHYYKYRITRGAVGELNLTIRYDAVVRKKIGEAVFVRSDRRLIP